MEKPPPGSQWWLPQSKQSRHVKNPYGRGRHSESGRTRRTNNPSKQSLHDKYKDVQQDPFLVMIISDLHPHTIVEEPGFVQFFQAMRYSCPSSNTVLSELQKLFLTTTGFVQDQLERVHHVTLTCEAWQTTENRTYMTTTCHLIDDTWTQKSLVLETTSLPEEYLFLTPSNVILQLLRIAQNWRIKDKIKIVITNVDRMNEEVEKYGWEHIPCFNHLLDFVFKITVILPDSDFYKTLFQKCCAIAKYFSQNVKAQSQLKKAQSKRRLSSYHLVEGRVEKWLSSLQMLERITAQRESISEVFINASNVDLLLSEQEHKEINVMISCLKVFQGVTVDTGKRYSLLSSVIPQVEEINKKLNELKQSQNEFAETLAQNFYIFFNIIIKNDWVQLSTAFDLRYRDIVLSDTVKMTDIKNKIISEMNGYYEQHNSEEVLNKYLNKVMLARYCDPLAFWKFPKDEDLLLSEVARKYLTAVSTAVPANIAFDMDKTKLVDSRRSSLDPQHLNMMLFLNGNSPYIRKQRFCFSDNLLENLKI